LIQLKAPLHRVKACCVEMERAMADDNVDRGAEMPTSGRAKLRWAELPRHALRNGAACRAGGARIMLLTDDDRGADRPPQAADAGARPDPAHEAGKPR
jgi:hypothetical protein